MMKRIIALMLVIVLSLSLAACGNKSEEKADTDTGNSSEQKENNTKEETSNEGSAKEDTTKEAEAAGPLFEEEVQFSLMMQSHPSWPYQEEWYVNDLLKRKANVKFNVNAVIDSNSAFNEKLNLTMAAGEVPDLIFSNTKEVIRMYGSQGAFLNVLDYEDQLPNFSKWKSENEEYVKKFMSNDGKLYIFPEKGIEESNRRGWLYRDDIFEKHGLDIPADEEELYTVLKQLKELYPDSYPLTFRSGMYNLLMIAPSWGTDWQQLSRNHQMYLNRDSMTWNFGPTEDNFKELAQYLTKLHQEELIPPNFLTLTTKEWQDIISNEQAFVTVDYLTRIDFFNNALQESNPDFKLRYMPPVKGGENGVGMMAASATGFYGLIPSAISEDTDALLKFCDWMYTDEASELFSWGEEGITYEVVDGNRQFIDAIDPPSIRKKYGLSTYGYHILFDYSAHISTFSPLVEEAVEASRNYDLLEMPSLEFSEEEIEIIQTIGVNIDKHTSQEISKFILGARDYSEWDQFVQEIEDMGLEKLKGVYESSYSRQ